MLVVVAGVTGIWENLHPFRRLSRGCYRFQSSNTCFVDDANESGGVDDDDVAGGDAASVVAAAVAVGTVDVGSPNRVCILLPSKRSAVVAVDRRRQTKTRQEEQPTTPPGAAERCLPCFSYLLDCLWF